MEQKIIEILKEHIEGLEDAEVRRGYTADRKRPAGIL